jgi:hypothetical protein
MTSKLSPKKVFVDVFTDYQQKFLTSRLDHTRGYLTSFANDERKQIAHRFLDKIEQAITDAYEEALAEDEVLLMKTRKNNPPRSHE